ncbi:MAG: FKBP-type peptidyl-prolyl cis-trans isomerase [Flavobacteriaceae bacterium]
MKKGFSLLVAALLFASCGSNNDDEGFTPVPIEPLATINEQNEAELVSFLQSHYYDASEAIRPMNDAPAKTLALWDDPRLKVKQVLVRPSEHNLDTEGYTEDEIANGIPHNLYYFIVQDGGGNSLSTADSVYVQYAGRTLDLNLFDQVRQGGLWFDLARIQAPQQGFRGFSEGAALLKTASEVIDNPDGTFSAPDAGKGFFFFGSALGSYQNAQATIPAYGPMFFELKVLARKITDHDGDGVPSYLEDLNNNGYLFDDNTDLDDEVAGGRALLPNYFDADDDGDGTPTACEISLGLDYLDPTECYDADGDGDCDSCEQ